MAHSFTEGAMPRLLSFIAIHDASRFAVWQPDNPRATDRLRQDLQADPRQGGKSSQQVIMTFRAGSSLPHQLVDRYWKVAYAFARGVVDCIGNSRRGAYDADLANALDAELVNLLVPLIDEDHVDRLHVRIRGNMVVGEIVRHEPAEPVVGRRLLVQRHADAADYGAENLARGNLRIENTAAATAFTRRVTRMTPSSSSILTSANIADWVKCAYLLFSVVGQSGSLARSTISEM